MSETAWILHALTELKQQGSWAGRTHLHKILFLADRLLDAKQPFEFELYRFGPYSFELDACVRNLDAAGLVEKDYSDSGTTYGPRYVPFEDWQSAIPTELDIPEDQKQKLQQIAKAIGNRTSSDLELIATCLWCEHDESTQGDSAIIGRVKQLKPRYQESEIKLQLSNLRKIQQSFVG